MRLPSIYRFPDSAHLILWSALLIALFAPLITLSGCGGEDNVEEQQADRDFARAREMLASGDHRGARPALTALVKRDRALGREARVAEELHMLASSYAAFASFDSAFHYYGAAFEQYKGVADKPSARQVQLEMANLHRAMGDDRKAFMLYTEMARLAKLFKEEDGLRTIRLAMLSTCRVLGERDEERGVLAELFSSPAMTGDPIFAVRAHLEAGISTRQEGRLDSAIQHLRQAFTLADKSPDSLLACTVLLELARTYDAAGKATETLQTYSEAIRRADRISAGRRIRQELLGRVGNLYLRNRQPTEAARFYRVALTSAIGLGDKIGEGFFIIQLAHCEPASKVEDALKYYRSALDLFSNYSSPRGMACALLSIASVQRKQNRINDAIQQLTASLVQEDLCLGGRVMDDVYGEGEQAFFGNRATPAYDELVDLHLQQGRTEDAFRYGSRRRAAVLFRALGPFRPRPAEEALLTALEEHRRERARVIGAERQLEARLMTASQDAQALAAVREVLESARARLAEKGAAASSLNPAYRPFVGIESPTLAEAHRMIPRGSALVYYLPTRRTLYALFLFGGRTAMEMAAVERSRVASLASEFLDSLASTSATESARLRELCGMLHTIFIRPITNDIAGVSRLYVVLPDELPLVPLHVLRRNSAQAEYFAERFPVIYLPSVNALELPGSSPAPVGEVIALGHPGTTDWDVEYELRDIRAFYKDTRLYFGQQATLATLQRERADLLHLAAEFRWDDRRPANSRVFLPDSKSPEILRSIPQEELVGLPGYPTVVVSNLASGYGSIHPAEPYLFLANGVRTVILDGYPPQRKTKKYFGEVFYTALLSGMPAAEAFHRAQLDMIKNKDYRSMRIWGAFFLWGR